MINKINKAYFVLIVILAIYPYTSYGFCNLDNKINEMIDLGMETLWPKIVQYKYTNLRLPNIINETVEVTPFFFTISTNLNLTNGRLYNMSRAERDSNVFVKVNLNRSAIVFSVKYFISHSNFQYDFNSNTIGFKVDGTTLGTIKNSTVRANFSMNAYDWELVLDDLDIIDYGDISVKLKDEGLISTAAILLLDPMTEILKQKFTKTLMRYIKLQLDRLMHIINTNDQITLMLVTITGLIYKCNFDKLFGDYDNYTDFGWYDNYNNYGWYGNRNNSTNRVNFDNKGNKSNQGNLYGNRRNSTNLNNHSNEGNKGNQRNPYGNRGYSNEQNNRSNGNYYGTYKSNYEDLVKILSQGLIDLQKILN